MGNTADLASSGDQQACSLSGRGSQHDKQNTYANQQASDTDQPTRHLDVTSEDIQNFVNRSLLMLGTESQVKTNRAEKKIE